MHHSQAMALSQVLFDSIGPRLTNSDRYNAGQDWLVKTYASWGITARKEPWGTWSSWKRGPTHLDLIAPRVRSLEAMMLAWSPGTEGRDLESDVVLLPDARTAEDFSGVAGGLTSTNFPRKPPATPLKSSGVRASGSNTTSPSTSRPSVPGLHASIIASSERTRGAMRSRCVGPRFHELHVPQRSFRAEIPQAPYVFTSQS